MAERRPPRWGLALALLVLVSLVASVLVFIYGTIGSAVSSWPAGARQALLAFGIVTGCSFLAGRFLERVHVGPFTYALAWIGGLHLGWMVYALLLASLGRFALFVAGFFASVHGAREILGWIVLLGPIPFVLFGLWGAHATAVRRLSLEIPKRAKRKTLRLGVASDLHLGSTVSHGRLRHLRRLMDANRVDLVLFPGDVIDGELGPVAKQGLGEPLGLVRGPLGALAVTGNHEYIGRANVAYLRKAGLTVLRDERVEIEGVVFAGRDDRSASNFGGRPRKSLAQILAGVDPSKPVILMDHTPARLDEAESLGVDLQLSGHTHHGQLWPFQFVTRRIFEVSRGFHRKGATNYFVSSGFGWWGMPMKTSARSEILVIDLTFTG